MSIKRRMDKEITVHIQCNHLPYVEYHRAIKRNELIGLQQYG